MVFKVSKGGVRTGNTLRGLNSIRTKRYGRHACLLGSTSLGRRDLTRFVRDSSDDNQLVKDTLGQTDVLLSLNKKQRWRVPAMIGHMIREGEFNDGPVVSLLEKHKLKRKANCVNLISNNSRTSCVVPKQKKYFSFCLDSIADDNSRRQRKRDRANALKKLKQKSLEKTVKSNSGTIRTYTADGTAPKLPVAAVAPNTTLASDNKPQYRLEVFYPCPQTCSLTYNPKYTDVTIAKGTTGKMEVHSVVKAPKKGLTTHRKRITYRDVERLQCQEIEDDVMEMWEECEEENLENDECSDQTTCQNKYSDIYSMENTIDALLTHAQKTKDLCILEKESYQRNKIKKKTSKRYFSEIPPDKSHVVFVEDDNMENITDHRPVLETHTKDNIGDQAAHDSFSSLDYCRVILPTTEVDSDALRCKYGSLYAEASCLSRRFVLDITADVTNLIGTSRASTREDTFSSYLVFIYDGFYDDGLVAYKIAFNSMVGTKMSGLPNTVPFSVTTISDVVNAVACHLLDCVDLSGSEKMVSREANSDGDVNFINSRIKLKVEVFDPSLEISKMAISNEDEEETEDPAVAHGHSQNNNGLNCADSDEDLFCDVCYASVTPSRLDSVSGTKLKSCGHLLCDECWASHFRTGLKDGKTVLTCAGYDCKTKVGPITLLSILNVSEVALLLQRQTEEKIETMDNAKWCPQPGCGRVIQVESTSKDLSVDVQCICGHQLCFSCSGPAHWPAKCEQAEEYLDKLPGLAPVKEYVEEQDKPVPLPVKIKNKSKKPTVVRLEGRLCPRCKKFIEKNGGCSHMMCRCGYSMCWECMKPMHYYGTCKMDYAWIEKHTKILVVKHNPSKEPVSPDPEKVLENQPKIQKNKQKASLYQKAFQEREESSRAAAKYNRKSQTRPLLVKMVKEAQRDVEFKREILSVLSTNIPDVDDHPELVTLDVSGYLKKFVESTVEMKKELHHVAEYTFILLQGTPHSVAKQRILKLINDLIGFCSFVSSILDLQDNQNTKTAFRRLVDLQKWGKRALDALIRTTRSLRVDYS